jgi:hypothetical protein
MLASQALERIKEDGVYDFNQLPATDVKQKLILPMEYENQL